MRTANEDKCGTNEQVESTWILKYRNAEGDPDGMQRIQLMEHSGQVLFSGT